MIRKSTEFLVIHCSASPPNVDVGVAEIRQWHLKRGFSDIGYHFVIRRDGRVEIGRPENLVGSHVRGHNSNSLGICLVGGTDARQRPENNFTAEQWASLQTLLMRLTQKYPNAKILGHRDFPQVAKACPCFDAIKWAQGLGLPAAKRMRPAMASLAGFEAAPEIEDGDEADMGEGNAPGFPDSSPAPTGPGKWATALFGGGGLGLFGGYGYGLPPIVLLVVAGLTAVGVVGFLIAIGRERREKLWDKMVGGLIG
jgi:hypothetical protein